MGNAQSGAFDLANLGGSLAISSSLALSYVGGDGVTGINVSNIFSPFGVVATDLLGPLQDNVGPAPTHALVPGSLLIDAGDSSLVPSTLTTDANGALRISGGIVDIGAVEFQQTPDTTDEPPGDPIDEQPIQDPLFGDDLITITTIGVGPVAAGPGNDTVQGSAGAEVAYGNQGNDQMFGAAGADTLFGGKDQDFLDGGADDDVGFGNKGNDTLIGGVGNDLLFGGQDQDTMDGGSENDTLFGNKGHDTLLGGSGDDVLYGNHENDLLFGSSGNDTIYAGAGADTIDGGAGNDVLAGNLGNDIMAGGAGADLFVLSVSGGDVIFDYLASEGDVITGGGFGPTSTAFVVEAGLQINNGFGGAVVLVGVTSIDQVVFG